jgi:hypothetical protein
VKELRRLPPDRLARAEEWLRNPPAGSRAAAAREYGIDLTLLITQLRLTPAERAEKAQRIARVLDKYRGAARKRA